MKLRTLLLALCMLAGWSTLYAQQNPFIGNWKMNPETAVEAKKLAVDVKRNINGIRGTQIVMCPPFIYLPLLSGLTSTKILIGSQDAVCALEEGMHQPL